MARKTNTTAATETWQTLKGVGVGAQLSHAVNGDPRQGPEGDWRTIATMDSGRNGIREIEFTDGTSNRSGSATKWFVRQPAGEGAAKAPVAPQAPAATNGEGVDVEALRRTLKSAKGVLWTMNHRGADATKITAQEAKVATLKAQLGAVAPSGRGEAGFGPSWVVSIDPATGEASVAEADDDDAVRAARSEARAEGLTVLVVAKVAK